MGGDDVPEHDVLGEPELPERRVNDARRRFGGALAGSRRSEVSGIPETRAPR